MTPLNLGQADAKALEQVLGYLNFSDGGDDSQFLTSLKSAFRIIREQSDSDSVTDSESNLKQIQSVFQSHLETLKEKSAAFKDAEQAQAVLNITFDEFVPFYLSYHSNLLFHQTVDSLFSHPLMLGCVFQSVLKELQTEDKLTLLENARKNLDDYVGYRPIPTLETRKHEPYPHEWVRPIPIYVKDVGVAFGKYTELVELGLEILERAEPAVLRAAQYDPEQLHELTIDPRAYDFDHPVNRRPNYHFGQWDPMQIDNGGRYTRYVIQQVTLDSLIDRYESNTEIPKDELLFEAAAVLAGTILMGSGMSGYGPGAFDSTVSLGTLMPVIAQYRDAFYKHLISNLKDKHGERLREEAVLKRQPFGAARQSLNASLANLRAAQLQHVHLANTYARMGFPDAARKQANIIPVASARMMSRIDCRMTTGRQAIQKGDFETGLQLLDEIVDLLKRAIDCGAMIDPWNILGFDANFSLFPAYENSIRDHRADELVDLVEDVFSYCSLLWSESAAAKDEKHCDAMKKRMGAIAEWWDQFATHEVSAVDSVNGHQVYEAAENVVGALKLWNEGGSEVGDMRFWASHSSLFQSPQAYTLVIEFLLQKYDTVASMALLIHWLGQADIMRLEQGSASFQYQTLRWMFRRIGKSRRPDLADEKTYSSIDSECWNGLAKFLDYIEANAEARWSVPQIAIGNGKKNRDELLEIGEMDREPEDELYDAAYENVVYQDSTNDGNDGPIHEGSELSDSEYDNEVRRLEEHFVFLDCVSKLWQTTAAVSVNVRQPADEQVDCAEFRKKQQVALDRWCENAIERRKGLDGLLNDLKGHRLPDIANDYDAMVSYDRERWFKEHVSDRTIDCYVENEHAIRVLQATKIALAMKKSERDDDEPTADLGTVTQELLGDYKFEEDQLDFVQLLAAVLLQDRELILQNWDSFIESVSVYPVSYIPLSRGGDPQKIVRARVRQNAICQLLVILTRLSLYPQCANLIDTVRAMEVDNPVGNGALTEFDHVFQIGFNAIVESVVQNHIHIHKDCDESQQADASDELFQKLKKLTEPLMVIWLEHSRTLRLSVMERVSDKHAWSELEQFIKDYGKDIFTQRFFNLSNIRAILHQGVEEWFYVVEESSESDDIKLFQDLQEGKVNRRKAAAHMSLVLEAIIENFAEYRDYNSTTTQSDQGDMLFTLLDFLRLRMRYDRIAWHLNPIKWAHQVLVENQQDSTAESWRNWLCEQVQHEAPAHLKQLGKLQKKHAMVMPTIADRIEERFVKPLQIDRLRSLIPICMKDLEDEHSQSVFEILEEEIEVMCHNPTGVGFDVPSWIVSLQEEVSKMLSASNDDLAESELWIGRRRWLSSSEIDDQIEQISVEYNPHRDSE